MMKQKWLKMAVATLGLSVVLVACGGTATEDSATADETAQSETAEDTSESDAAEETDAEDSTEDDTATDYADVNSWFQKPAAIKKVDTFYIYPTLYDGTGEDAQDYAPIDDAETREKIKNVYQSQASVFEESTNVFVPYYRQASLALEVAEGKEGGGKQTALESEPRTDIYAALDYYFENENDGRPFIIAGHSQGAAMTRMALKEYFKEHSDYYEQMVAAYVIGFSITEDDLADNPHLHFAEGEDDTGVVVSWNTEGPENKDATNLVLMDGSVAINPLNWKRDETYASAEENKGSFLLNEDTGEYEITDIGADAQLDLERGVVVCTTDYPSIAMKDAFGPASFHNGDYGFYYENIKENVAKRIDKFLAE